jgi:Ribosome biogenesis protein SLX9
MVKRKPLRTKAPPNTSGADAPAASGAPAAPSRLGGIGKESVLSRGKRKRFEKRDRATRKEAFVEEELRRLEAAASARRSALAARDAARAPPVKRPLTHMHDLADGLDLDTALGDHPAASGNAVRGVGEDGSAQGPQKTVMHERARRRILVEETIQVKQVVKHPAFQANPIEALRQHLLNTVAADPLAAIPEAVEKAPKDRNVDRKPGPPDGATLRAAAKTSRTTTGRSTARDMTAQRREHKADLAARAARISKSKRPGKEHVPSRSRGRIGEQRPKILN